MITDEKQRSGKRKKAEEKEKGGKQKEKRSKKEKSCEFSSA